MIKAGFLPDDPLFLLDSEAYDAVYRLHMETHYLSCNGVWRKSANEDDGRADSVTNAALLVNPPALSGCANVGQTRTNKMIQT